MPDPRMVTLESLSEGAAGELFAAALRDVLQNVDDPNTDHKAKREITLKFVFKSDEQRRHAEVGIQCSKKLAGVRPVGAIVHIGRHQGELVMVEAARQEDMFTAPIGRPQKVASEGAAS